MIRLFARAVVALIADAVALLVASSLLEDFHVNAEGFIIAVVIFSATDVISEALLRQAAFRSAPALLGSSALIATAISLLVTEILSDGLKINGFTAYLAATVLVWVIALGVKALLPLIIFKETLARRDGP